MANTIVSYAQAAKGQNASPAQPSPQPSSSPAPSSHPKEDTTAADSTYAAASSVASVDAETQDLARSTQFDANLASLKQDLAEAASVAGSAASTVSTTEKSISQHGDSETKTADSSQNSEDKSRSASRTSRSNDGADSKKGRKGKKGRSGDKDSDMEKSQEIEKEIPKPVLTEAKPPPVNIWQQRAEAQKAKAKPTPSGVPSASPSASTPNGTNVDAKKRNPAEENDPAASVANVVNGDKPQRRPTDLSRGSEQVSRRTGPRGSRVQEKDEKANGFVPSVADASLWPEPKSAGVLDEEKRKVLDKPERSGDKEGVAEADTAKGQKQKWVAMPFVPSAVFETPLPPRNPKPRGAGRGGREAGAGRVQGGAAGPVAGSTGDKGAAAAGPGSAKPSESHQRDSSISTRGAAVATNPSKRGSLDNAYPRDQRKSSASAAKESGAENQAVSLPRPPRTLGHSRVNRFANAANQTQTGNGKTDAPRPAGQVNPEAPNFTSRTDRRNDQTQTLPGQQPFPGREGRSDRGRGGFRRGGHGGPVGPHMPQATYPPVHGQYPHMPFPNRQNGPYSPPPFQTGFANGFNPSAGRGGRNGNRASVSGSTQGRSSSSNGHGYPPKVNPLSPGNHYEYPLAPFATPFPYPYAYEPSLLQIAQTQVEYYMSVENLCKDRFIRQRMDGMGFIDLNIIAGFKRIQDLTKGDLDIIRNACVMSDKLEFVRSEDGVERLRAREHWASFTLPKEERVPEARMDAPPPYYVIARPQQVGPFHGGMIPSAYTATSPTMFTPGFPMEDQMFQPPPYVNGGHYDQGLNGVDANGQIYNEGSQLSAAVPEFSPNGAALPLTLDSMTNFADSKVEHLMMVLQSAKKNASSPHQGPNGAVKVNGVSTET